MNSPSIKTAAILDNFEPEFESYLCGESIDLYLLPSIFGDSRKWFVPSTSIRRTVWLADLMRALFMSSLRRDSGERDIERSLRSAHWRARAFARQIPVEVEHLIVAQDYLPFLWRMGVLRYRTFDVLLSHPPLTDLYNKIARACDLLPASRSNLENYCVSLDTVSDERAALLKAERVITSHEDYANQFANLRKLEWQLPEVVPPASVRRPRYLLFPASLTARDGAHAALAASDQFELPLLVVGQDPEGLTIKSDLVEFISEEQIPWHEVALVLHPALFESWPRLHLQALALGIPVVATKECGIEDSLGVIIVPFADEGAIALAVERALSRELEELGDERHTERHTERSYGAKKNPPISLAGSGIKSPV